MNNCKIRVNNEAESREAQELFFELGYRSGIASNNHFPVLVVAHDCGYGPESTTAISMDHEHHKCYAELTLHQLRDLVVLHRNDIDDANWETEGDDQIYQDSSGKSFIFREQGWDELQRHEMRQAMWEKTKSKPQTPENEQGLISGADALRALADGEDVQQWNGNIWWDVEGNYQIDVFRCGKYKFRLKPRTVKLEIEVPAPFEPKVGEEYFYIQSCKNGYAKSRFNSKYCDQNLLSFGAWRTEADIKIVVAQLRKLKEHSK
ncbi:MAG: hypothetical protein E7I55_04515 [Acinetobacter ursingii]|nr:hypothetical protein [Acinetobacter ursingii]